MKIFGTSIEGPAELKELNLTKYLGQNQPREQVGMKTGNDVS
jgi:hypothetical protein